MTLSEKAARKGSSMKKHRRTFFVIENFDGIKKIAEILEWKGTSAIFLYEIAFAVLLKIKMKGMVQLMRNHQTMLCHMHHTEYQAFILFQ